jgi:hypothetical protein
MGNLCQPFHPLEGEGAYRIIKNIGSGYFLAKRFSDNQKFIIKTYNCSFDRMLTQEIRVCQQDFESMKRIDHPFVIKVIE